MLTSNPQRLAWITLSGALAIFCLMCVSLVLLARWVVFESPTQLNSTLYVGRGTVGQAAPDSDDKAIRSPSAVEPDDRLTTDNTSQGYLAFSDPYSGDVVATVMLRRDSAIKLHSASRPRFNLSDNPYAIRLTNATGRFHVWISDDLERDIRLEIEGPLGTLHIEDGGQFLIDSTPEYLTAHARLGSATLISRAGPTQHLSTSLEGTIRQGEMAIQVKAGPVDLLTNWNFDQSEDWPVQWGCAYDSPDNPNGPSGQWFFKRVDGRGAVHIERMQPEPGPGKTLCIQVLSGPEGGLDVSEFESLRLRVTVQIHHQSLSACGVAGTECPVFLGIRYTDVNGNRRNWYHGFYAEYRPNEGRATCGECWGDHEQVVKDAWYTYESDNLLTYWIEAERPQSIESIEFRADGHQYDVMLSEVALIATLPGVPSTDATVNAPSN